MSLINRVFALPRSLWGSLVWLLFGNDDDGIIGDLNWNPTQLDTWGIRVRWWCRNPFHNLFFYVLGVARLPQDGGGVREGVTRAGRYPTDVFNPNGGWNWACSFYKTSSFDRVCGAIWLIAAALNVQVAAQALAAFIQSVVSPDFAWSWALIWPLLACLGWLAVALLESAIGFRLCGVMPFLSYKGAVKAYLGWRERGNFGPKLTKG